MRIFLVQSRPPARRGFRSGFKTMVVTEPLGLEMVASALAGKHEVQILDALPGTDIERLAVDFRPDACGVSCSFTVGVRESVRLTELLKSLPTHPFVFIGGHHASLNARDFLHPSIDAVVSGEGEESAAEMILALETPGDSGAVPGLVLNRGQAQELTPTRPLAGDLDRLPFPARKMTDRWRSRYCLGLRAPIASP